jgi:predicted ATP-grasp superfamily ATP-dependent carboligase
MSDKHKWLRESTGLYRKETVRFKLTIGDVTLREFSNCEVDGAILIEGFPSISLASILSAGYIREQLKLPLIGVMTSPKFPPRCIIENGVPIHPIRIYGNKQVVVCLCEFKIPTPELTYEVVSLLLDFADRHKCTLFLTVEGLPLDDIETSSEVFDQLAFVSTKESFTKKMTELGHHPLNDGVIVGVTSMILAEGALARTDVACLIVGASSKYPEARGAVNVVKAINSYMPELNIDIVPLEMKASQLEKSVQEILQKEKTSNSLYS